MAESVLTVEVVSATHPVWSGPASFVTAPTPEGSIGIYPRHQPLLSLLAPGQIRIDSAEAASVHARVSGGFISVDSDVVTVVTDEGEVVAA